VLNNRRRPIDFESDTVWATYEQMAALFGTQTEINLGAAGLEFGEGVELDYRLQRRATLLLPLSRKRS